MPGVSDYVESTADLRVAPVFVWVPLPSTGPAFHRSLRSIAHRSPGESTALEWSNRNQFLGFGQQCSPLFRTSDPGMESPNPEKPSWGLVPNERARARPLVVLWPGYQIRPNRIALDIAYGQREVEFVERARVK